MLGSDQHPDDERDRREEIEHPVSETDPISVAVVPLRSGNAPAQYGGARISPTRPGRTALANRPTQNAEKTRRNFGGGGSIDCSMQVCHEIDRATTERQVEAIATATQATKPP